MRVDFSLHNFAVSSMGQKSQKADVAPSSLSNASVFEFPRYSPLAYASTISFGKNGEFYPNEVGAQPEVLKKLSDRYFKGDDTLQNIKFADMPDAVNAKTYSGIDVLGSGSARHVAMMAQNFVEEASGLPMNIEYASQAAHKPYRGGKNALVVAISQSGTTGDTKQALQEVLKARQDSEYTDTVALVNVPDTPIWNMAEYKVPVGAGTEKSIAATKSVTAQLFNLWAIGLRLGDQPGTKGLEERKSKVAEVKQVPGNVEKMLQDTTAVNAAAEALKDKDVICILGRDSNLGTALEGHLKLKEMTNKDTIAYSAGDFEHGPSAALKENQAVIMLLPGLDNDNYFQRAKANLDSVLMLDKPDVRKAHPEIIPDTIVIFKDEQNKQVEQEYANVAKNVVFVNIPHSSENISPMYNLIRFHQLSGRICELTGKDPDGSPEQQPRLEKSVKKAN